MSISEQPRGPPSTNSSTVSMMEEGRASDGMVSTNPSSTDLGQENSSLPQRRNRPSSRRQSWAFFGPGDRRRAASLSLPRPEISNDSRMNVAVEELGEVRIVAVGGAGVGKSSLIRQMVGNRSPRPPPPTTECATYRLEPTSLGAPTFIIGDTIGRHDGRPEMGPVQDFILELNPHVFLLCFLLGDDESLAEILVIWSRFARSVVPTAQLLLVGLGSDQLVDPMNGVWRINLVYKVQNLLNAADFIECSGLTGEGVDRILATAHQLAYQSVLQSENPSSSMPWPHSRSSTSSPPVVPPFGSSTSPSSRSLPLPPTGSRRTSTINRLSVASSPSVNLNRAQTEPRRRSVRIAGEIAVALRIKSKSTSSQRSEKKQNTGPQRNERQQNLPINGTLAGPGLNRKSSLASLLSPKRWRQAAN